MSDSTVIETLGELEFDLRQELEHPTNVDKVAVVIEGDDDLKLYRKVFNGDSVFFFVSGSCYYVVEITENWISYQDRIIGIKDADFDTVLGIDYSDIPNLFLTDAHDAEMLMVDKDIINDILMEYIGEKDDNIIARISKGLSWYSYLRLLNQIKSGLNIKFHGFGIGKLFKKPEYSIDKKTCLDKIKAHGRNNLIVDFPTEKDLDQLRKDVSLQDSTVLCNGHDFTCCLAIYISGQSKKGISGDDICHHLRINYNLDKFKMTKLYSDIDEWCQARGYHVWV